MSLPNTNFSVLAPRKKAAIGLTSLIDVVFILLLFFMLSSSFSPKQALDLQNASAGASTKQTSVQPIVVDVISNARWKINDESCESQTCLISAIKTRQSETQGTTIAIRSDAKATLQNIVTAMAILDKAKLPNVILIPSPEANHVPK